MTKLAGGREGVITQHILGPEVTAIAWSRTVNMSFTRYNHVSVGPVPVSVNAVNKFEVTVVAASNGNQTR